MEKIFGKAKTLDELERDLTERNELIAIVKGGLKSRAGKKTIFYFTFP